MPKVDRLTGRERPLEEVWREGAREDYEEMRQEGLLAIGIIRARGNSSFEQGPETIRVRMEEEADELQQIMIASEAGDSNRVEELRLKRIELCWEVWQEEAKRQGDKEVHSFVTRMRLDLFGAEKEEWNVSN